MHLRTWLVIFGIIGGFSLSAQRWGTATGDDFGPHPSRSGYYRATGNAVVTLEDMRILCDFADYSPSAKATECHGNLRIYFRSGGVITGKRLVKEPSSELIVITGDVVYKDKGTTLYTDQLLYSEKTKFAYYLNGGRILSDSTVLTSIRGYFLNSNSQTFFCKKDVVVVAPSYTIHTDTLKMEGQTAHFFVPTYIQSDSTDIYCEAGWYNGKDELAFLHQNASIRTQEQILYGDTIYYRKEIDQGEAFGHVLLVDSIQNIQVRSQYALSERKEQRAVFTQDPVVVMISDQDTLFLRGDTLRVFYDSLQQLKNLFAYPMVRFYREDIQGSCDSMAYLVSDSSMHMYRQPIIWSGNDQLYGDTIHLRLSDNKPRELHIRSNSFIGSKGYQTGQFNQINGRNVQGFFNDSSQLRTIYVYEDAQSIYYVPDDIDSSLIGIHKAESVDIRIDVEDGQIAGINYILPSKGSMHPERELPLGDRKLKGFVWRDAERPKNRKDIHPDL